MYIKIWKLQNIQQKKKPKPYLDFSELRRQDSNMRPPGYEPGELPTAPLRDVISCKRVQRYCFFLKCPNIARIIFQKD